MPTTSHSPAIAPHALDAPMKKVIWRIVPILFICYIFNFLDRINVGFAQLQMKQHLAFSDAVYGLGAGLFFIGYFFFEVPSNILLERIGARKTILRIMVLWGLTSAATMFVQTPTQFYVIRFLLGLFEAGFFPGIILYLTFWVPNTYRARVIALFMSSLVVTGMIAGPVSGLILQNMDGFWGLRGWQWMFVIEGLPSCLLGVFVFFYLDDKPEHASWLSPSEKQMLTRVLDEERHASQGQQGAHPSLRKAFAQPLVYLFSFVYFAILAGGYIIAFWLPMTIRELGVSNFLHIGLYSAIPYAIAGIAMIGLGKSSDHFNERRLHVAIPAFIGAMALLVLPQANHSLALSLAILAVATAGLYASLSPFWTVATISLSRAESAAGIALIASLGNLAGFVSPFIIGKIRTETGSSTYGIYLMATIVVLGVIALLIGSRRSASQSPRKG
ncbi:MFS transporter [Lampropedia puyangensis]|uniref:MFS transporter n=1 Tax=Lampropedia puyangensis TaxID=1330072 RepID=A0A4S8F847_9BURK|nr:MFS transporter [Lampropedia puyangensis]THU01532.1 MFS transporter [Lampropedia puyangensis]